MKKFSLLTSVFCCVFISSAFATPYFPAEKISPAALDKPFAVGSDEMKNEIENIIKLQKKVKENEIRKAESERNLTPEMLAWQVDKNLRKEKFPKLYAMLDRVLETSYFTAENCKKYWNQKRPYLLDKRVKPLIEAHETPAYPSGHTTVAYSLIRVLALLIPEKSAALYAHAEEIAQHRVLVGMHFERDLDGGRRLAELIFAELVKNKEFQKDLEAVREEIIASKAN